MALDSTGLRIVRRGVRVMMGPFLWDVVKVTTSGQAWLRGEHLETLICRPTAHCTVYDAALQPAGPADIPLIEVPHDDHG